jgi:hypothetical protein
MKQKFTCSVIGLLFVLVNAGAVHSAPPPLQGKDSCLWGFEVNLMDKVLDHFSNNPVKGAIVEVWDSITESSHRLGMTDADGKCVGRYNIQLYWPCICQNDYAKNKPSACSKSIQFKATVSAPGYRDKQIRDTMRLDKPHSLAPFKGHVFLRPEN